jgi:hypothetical protein
VTATAQRFAGLRRGRLVDGTHSNIYIALSHPLRTHSTYLHFQRSTTTVTGPPAPGALSGIPIGAICTAKRGSEWSVCGSGSACAAGHFVGQIDEGVWFG